MDDFVINVRQIAQYPQVVTGGPNDALLIQTGGLGGPYNYISPVDLVGTALAQAGTLHLAPGEPIQWNGQAFYWNTGGFVATDTLRVPGIQSAGDVFVAGEALAKQSDLEASVAAILAGTVSSFNFRTGAVQLQTDDVLRAGGAPIHDAHFGGFNTSPTPWDFRSNDDQIATTAFVQLVLNQVLCGGSVVTSFNGRGGAVTLQTGDVNAAFAVPGPPWPTASSPALGDASNRIATTLFVDESMADLAGTIPGLIDTELTNAQFAPLDSPDFTGVPTAPTAAPGSHTGQIATTAYVQNAVTASTTGVASFNTRTGAVVLLAADVTGVGGALLSSPAFVGTPTSTTATPGDSSGRVATTAFVAAAISALPTAGVTSFNTRTGAVTLTTADVTGAGGAPTVSPALTGTPTAPTAAAATNTTQIATTAFVANAVAALGTTVTAFNGRTGSVTLLNNDISAAGGALLAGPAFTGVPTAPTATVGTSTTQLATTAFVQAAVTAGAAGVTSWNTRTGAVTLTAADVTGVGGALLASPALSGTPTAPTAAQTSNDTTIATTSFVHSAVAAGGVTSFNSRTGAVTFQANDISAVGGALLSGPAFTGVPTAPTAATNTNTTQIATTAFVMAQLATAGGVTSFNGRAGVVTLTASDVTNAGGSTGQINVQTFTASGTYTPSAGMKYCTIECVGGGGGGTGVADSSAIGSSGAGGGSGGYSRKTASAATIGASQAVTIGTAGNGGTAAGGNGGNGTASSVGTICVAQGGTGGTGYNTSTPSGGGPGGSITGAVGDIVAAGTPGQNGGYYASQSGAPGGCGGSSYFGGGGRGASYTSAAGSTVGGAASNYGGGGGGASGWGTTTTRAGGAGSAGFVVITEHM